MRESEFSLIKNETVKIFILLSYFKVPVSKS